MQDTVLYILIGAAFILAAAIVITYLLMHAREVRKCNALENETIRL